MTGLLARRGVVDVAGLTAWFAEPLAGLHDPRLLPDADRLLERLTRARDLGERVMVFGDFDADGLDGLAILVIALRRFGVDVEPYVPSRLDEGHGLSLAAIDAAVAAGQTVIVTVDCGTSSAPEIAVGGRARHRRDRHRPPSRPAASCRPRMRSSTRTVPTRAIPDARLAGSGVAFKVAQLLLADLPGGPAAALDLADLATVGTVADVAPIVGENRAIARLGLEQTAHGSTAGLRGPAGTRPDRAGGGRPRHDRIRARSPAERRGPGGGGARGRTAAARAGRARQPLRTLRRWRPPTRRAATSR